MPFPITRRTALLALASAFASRSSLADTGAPADELTLGEPTSFAFEALVGRARAMAKAPYVPPRPRAADVLDRLDYDQHVDIRFREERTLWAERPFPLRLFHLGKFFKEPVSIHLVEGGQAREVHYRGDLFIFGPRATFARDLPADLGFAGFRVMNSDGQTDWLAFLGASYFRTAGELAQYGLSARGIAIDTGLPTPEEFPRFTGFWIEEMEDEIVVHALLDGPSIAGAYRIRCRHPGAVLMHVEARLFARADIKRLGVAPLTSMFWYSEYNRRGAPDWRPEVHDSDGLTIWTGSGERLWRPLDNPPRVMTNSFLDANPKGFGLLQRDRDFASYEDDGVFYDRRPSVWVEPIGQWGSGAVQLLEIPTDAEIHDNIGAYWVPETPVRKGDALAFDYRLHWVAEEPFAPPVGRVVSTRRGRAGKPGLTGVPGVKFVIDFEGGDLPKYQSTDGVVPVISVSRGRIVEPYAIRVYTRDKWRLIFDLDVVGAEPVNLRAYLRAPTGEALTETWLSQHFPES